MSASTVRGVRVPAAAAKGQRVIAVGLTKGDHAGLCSLVGDVNTDAVFIEGAGVAYVAANGAENQPVNRVATMVVEHFMPGFANTGTLFGPVVFLGLDAGGDIVDVPAAVVSVISEVLDRF